MDQGEHTPQRPQQHLQQRPYSVAARKGQLCGFAHHSFQAHSHAHFSERRLPTNARAVLMSAHMQCLGAHRCSAYGRAHAVLMSQ
eukprot:scaffold273833_cov18-Tisochrysis_lutea.AAC.1